MIKPCQVFNKRSLSVLCFLVASQLHSQGINPEQDKVFREGEVMEIYMTMSVEDKEQLHLEENRWSEIYVQTDVTFTNTELSAVTVRNVGVRLRGNTARSHDKRAYKIDFKEYGGDQFEKYKKINLKPNVNDPALVRELLTMHLYRKMGVPAPLVGLAELYINEEYMGVYLMIEQIDDEFVDKRFGKEVGWLYKCHYGATLENDGQIFDEALYESKMNEESDTRAQLKDFVEMLENTPDNDFKEKVEQAFEVDRFIRQLAVEAITGHWDGYSYLNNNYYFYYDEDAGKFEFIAYDTDNTWGIDWVDRDWATRDLTHFYRHNHPRPLTERILGIPEYERRYYGYLNILFDRYFTKDYLYPIFDQLESILSIHVQNDKYFDDSFEFSHQDFLDAFDYTSNQHVAYGLRDFLETRRSTGIPQVPDIVLESHKQTSWSVYPNPSTNGIFTIKGSVYELPEIHLWNLGGKEILPSIEHHQDEIVLSIGQGKGLYLLEVDGVVTSLLVD